MKEYDEILNELKKKIYKPVYFFHGEEPYYMDRLTEYIAGNILTDAEKTFNQMVYYGKDTSIDKILDAARRFPMMANNQVVIIKEAQELQHIEKLIPYFEKPQPSTILVINYKKKLDKRTKLATLASKHVSFETKKIPDYKIVEWINNYLKKSGYNIGPEASQLLADHIGEDLSRIAHELDKLMLVIPKDSKTITKELIEQNIGISKDYNVFELQKTLGTKNHLKANRIIEYLGANPKANPPYIIISVLFKFFSNLLIYHHLDNKSPQHVASSLSLSHVFFVKEVEVAARNYSVQKIITNISILREYDLKTKGIGSVNTPPYELMRELLFKLMH
ncbi:MAG TPA: DNA polymerase III subunit delta [Bacteroidales bacterium]|nr:DNA polymerase III subunit delta [Bacteroidales bacterium]